VRLILFLLTCNIFLQAADISLNEIIQKLKEEHPTAKAIKAYEAAYSAENRAILSNEALQLNTDGSYAKPDLEKSGYEYSIGVEQKFINPSVKKSIAKSARYLNDAEILNLKHDFLLLQNDVRLLYHLNCLDKEAILQYKESYLAFETLYIKKEKAYQYGEISKKELLQLKIELERLKGDLNYYQNQEKSSREALASKTLMPIFKDETLSCKDTYSVVEKLSFDTVEESMKEESLDKKIESLKSDFGRYDKQFDSFTLSAAYQDEIDTKKYVVGLSIPLNFTSSFNEESRAVALHKKSALEYEKQKLKLKRGSEIKLLQKQLSQAFQSTELSASILKQYENELMPLIERGYQLGEDSAIVYLLSQREMWMYKKELIENYKKYYEILFELYSVLQIKD